MISVREIEKYLFAFKFYPTRGHCLSDRILIGKSCKRKAFAPLRLAIIHDGRVHDSAKLAEELLEGFRCHCRSQTADKDFGCTFVFCSRNRSLRVDLVVLSSAAPSGIREQDLLASRRGGEFETSPWSRSSDVYTLGKRIRVIDRKGHA